MLTRTVLVPAACTAIPLDHLRYSDLERDFRDERCGTVIAVLRDLSIHACILTDDGNAVWQSIRNQIARWPVKYRDRAMAYIEEIERRRLVKRPPSDATVSAGCCNERSCSAAFSLLSASTVDCLITDPECDRTACRKPTGASDCMILHQYMSSPTAARHATWADNGFVPSAWTRDKLEQELFAPVFSTAKRVTVWDRWIGKHMQESQEGTLSPGYRESIRWLYEMFERHSPFPSRTFTLATGFEADATDLLGSGTVQGVRLKSDSTAARRVRDLRAEVESFASSSLPIALDVRIGRKPVAPRHGSRSHNIASVTLHPLPHDRYLIMPVVTLAFGQGFDLTMPNSGEVHKTSINRGDPTLAGAYNRCPRLEE